MPIAILAITISFLYILKHDADSAEQKKLRSLIDKLHIQQMEFLTQNEELTQQRIELGEKQAEISEQNEELLQQKEELRSVNDALQDTFQQLQTTTQRLSKSINYAQNIQRVVLPTPEDLGLFFSENFTLYLPKDIVSGDFYWFQSLDAYRSIFIMADCTGHGVPGAFMSMIANTLLNEIVNSKKITNPADILAQLHRGIFYLLKQGESKNTDGMDLSICLFTQNTTGAEIQFSGARQFIIYIKNGQLYHLEADRISVGGGSIASEHRRQFSTQKFSLDKGDTLYLFSDGFIDQNNAARRRFGSSNFKHLIEEIKQLSLKDQRDAFIDALQAHQQDEEQRDDISLVGLRI